MSSKKRRVKHKIRQLVRMDATRSRMTQTVCEYEGQDEKSRLVRVICRDNPKPLRFWNGCIAPLYWKLCHGGQGVRVVNAMLDARNERVKRGGDV